MGKTVVTKGQVLQKVDGLTKKFAETHTSEETKRYRNQLAEGSTFFSIDVVWDTAKGLGTVGNVSPVPGFGGDFADLRTLPSWIVQQSSLIVLGLDLKGNPHAVAVRDGVLYDSQRWAPPDGGPPRMFSNAELAKSLSRVFTMFVVAAPGQERTRIIRIQPTTIKPRRRS
ncbi:MAG: hypothetical protein P4L69_15690 [Desulfosporosinus sp.]|nr:hypothetical protein [Desulfosporosinus sp.]